MEENIEKTLSKFLKIKGVPFPIKTFEKVLKSHPDYPSLLSISDVMERFGIHLNIKKWDQQNLDCLTFPTLLLFPNTKRDDHELTILRNKKEFLQKSQLFQKVTTILLQPELISQTKEILKLSLIEKLYGLAYKSLLLIIILLIVLLQILNFNLLITTLTIMSAVGIAIGYLLVAKDLGIEYKQVEDFCNSGKQSDCDSVLQSYYSKILGFFRLSDIVIIYFVFQLISVSISSLIPRYYPSYIMILAFLSLLSLPAIIYSLYIQYIKLKVWCKLCLGVIAILIVQAAFLGYLIAVYGNQLGRVATVPILISISIFIILYITVFWLKKSIERFKQIEQEAIISNRIKHTASIFVSFLIQQKKVDDRPFHQLFIIGEKNVPLNIIMAINLYCQPCSQKFEKLVQLVKTYPNRVNLTPRLLIIDNDRIDKMRANQHVFQYLLQNYFGDTKQLEGIEKIIFDWFKIMNFDRFIKKYPMEVELDAEKYKEIEKLHRNWFISYDISSTPTIFINGYQLPKNYDVEDLFAIVPGLTEETKILESKLTKKYQPPLDSDER